MLEVTVIYLPAPRVAHEWTVQLEEGACVLQALQASGIGDKFTDLDFETAAIGVWGCKAALDQPLRARDRVEIYRPLQVDPKVARRARFRRQGTRVAGLFTDKKAGGKGGY